MDLNAVEKILFTARGGVDSIFVDDLSGTGVTALDFDLAVLPGPGRGTAQPTVSSSTAPLEAT
jgi:hypothetical protein